MTAKMEQSLGHSGAALKEISEVLKVPVEQQRLLHGALANHGESQSSLAQLHAQLCIPCQCMPNPEMTSASQQIQGPQPQVAL